MRPRIILAAGFVTAILAACSQPGDRDLSSDFELERELELALAKAAQPAAVASQIEIASPAEPKKQAPTGKARTRPSARDLPELPEPKAELAPVAVPAPEPIMVAETEPVTAPAAPTSGPSATEGDTPQGDRTGDTEGRGRRPPIIIIRGGVGDDPCDIHRRPGRGVPTSFPGVLINPRTPPFAGPGSVPGPMSVPTRVGGGIRF